MKSILFRADDLGYSEGVNLGIAKSVREGLIQNVGVMSNMDTTKHGVELLKDMEVSLGLHCNISAGYPICPYEAITSLVEKDGKFKKSSLYKQNLDRVILEEACMEVEAQLLQFISLIGKTPSYMDGHAVASPCFFQAIEQVAKKYNIPYSPLPNSEEESVCIRNTMVYMHSGSSMQEKPEKVLHRIVSNIKNDEYHIMIYHPGFIDAYLLENSSLTTNRIFETRMLCDKECIAYLKNENIQRITYDQL